MTALFTKTMFAGTVASGNQECMTLLGRSGEDKLLYVSGEYGRYVLTENRTVVWSSPLLRLSSLLSEEFSIPFRPTPGKRKRLYLEYIKRKSGRAFTSWFRWPGRVNLSLINGRTAVQIPAYREMHPPVVRTARRWASRQVQLSRARRYPVPKKSTLRPSSELTNRPFFKTIETWNPNYSYTPSIIPILALYRTWTGVRTPNFGKLRKKALPVNPHSVLLKYGNVNRSFAGMFNKNTGWSSINIRPFTDIYADPIVPVHLPSARNIALQRLIRSNDLGIEGNLAQDTAQIGQTFRLISNSLSRITGSVTALKRGNMLGAVNALVHGRQLSSKIRKGTPSVKAGLANNWLELQYGWKPLLMDIEGSLKALSAYQGANDFVQEIVQQHTVQADQTNWTYAIGVSGQSSKYFLFQGRTKTTCRISLRFRLASPLRALLAQTGFTNPVNLFWEILPFSFVVDWFAQIGPYLEAFSAFDGLEFLDGWQVQFSRAKTVASHHNEQVSSLNALNTVFEHSDYEVEWVMLDRIKLNSFPMPTFPTLRNGLASNAKRAANAFALLQQVFGR